MGSGPLLRQFRRWAVYFRCLHLTSSLGNIEGNSLAVQTRKRYNAAELALQMHWGLLLSIAAWVPLSIGSGTTLAKPKTGGGLLME